LADSSVNAGEILVYFFPDFADLNADDILTPTLNLKGGSIPDFVTYNEELTYMRISPSLDDVSKTYNFTYYI